MQESAGGLRDQVPAPPPNAQPTPALLQRLSPRTHDWTRALFFPFGRWLLLNPVSGHSDRGAGTQAASPPARTRTVSAASVGPVERRIGEGQFDLGPSGYSDPECPRVDDRRCSTHSPAPASRRLFLREAPAYCLRHHPSAAEGLPGARLAPAHFQPPCW